MSKVPEKGNAPVVFIIGTNFTSFGLKVVELKWINPTKVPVEL